VTSAVVEELERRLADDDREGKTRLRSHIDARRVAGRNDVPSRFFSLRSHERAKERSSTSPRGPTTAKTARTSSRCSDRATPDP
jgi:hypothetical protein